MAAFDADEPNAASRIHRREIIAFDAIGTAHDFINHLQHSASSPSVSQRFRNHEAKVPCRIANTAVHTD
jgi:hypothetical protein